MIKLSKLELEKKENIEKQQGDIQKKEEEIDGFHKEVLKINQQVTSLEEQLNKLQSVVEEKEQLISQYKDKEKQLDNQNAEVSETVLLLFYFILNRVPINPQTGMVALNLYKVFSQIQSQLVTAEGKLGEAKKQYDAMLESKQSELSRHLKEISQRNDQVISSFLGYHKRQINLLEKYVTFC